MHTKWAVHGTQLATYSAVHTSVSTTCTCTVTLILVFVNLFVLAWWDSQVSHKDEARGLLKRFCVKTRDYRQKRIT